jgi:hypothetical protein
MGSMTSPRTARDHVSGSVRSGFAWTAPYTLPPGLPTPGIIYPPASPLCYPPQGGSARPLGHPLSTLDLGWARTRWYWNINQLCIDYAFRPRLSSRLTLGGLAFPRNPWAYGGGVSHPSLATHASILTRPRSTTVHTAASLRGRRSPTTPASYHRSRGAMGDENPQLRLLA